MEEEKYLLMDGCEEEGGEEGGGGGPVPQDVLEDIDQLNQLHCRRHF